MKKITEVRNVAARYEPNKKKRNDRRKMQRSKINEKREGKKKQ